MTDNSLLNKYPPHSQQATDGGARVVKNVVWYHASCLDGTCAAWVASHYLDDADTLYQPMQYGDKGMTDHIRYCKGKRLYILDWMPEDMKDLQELVAITESLVIIDHHDSSIRKFDAAFPEPPNKDEVFLARNNEWSGAMGTAIWFFNHWHPDTKCIIRANPLTDHWLVQAVDDRDRWQFKLPDTKEINEGLFARGFELSEWQCMDFSLESTREGLIRDGHTLIKQREGVVDQLIKSGLQYIDDANDNAFAAIINAPYYLASDLGNQIVQDHKFLVAIIWSIDKDYRTHFNFRSNAANPKAIDCGKLATSLGGGGHINAAGAKIALPYPIARDLLEEALLKL